MTFAPVKPGGWSEGEKLRSVHLTALQALLVQAVDGVGGGSYTLGSNLIFGGAELRIASVFRVLSGGTLIVNAGGDATFNGETVFNGALDLAGTSELTGTLTVQDGANLIVAQNGLITVNLGGRISMLSGADMDMNSGSTLSIETGAAANVQGDINLLSGGQVDVQNGAFVNIESGGKIVGVDGAEVQVRRADDLTINEDAVNFKVPLVPAFITQALTPGENDWTARADGAWVCHNAIVGSMIGFPLKVRPGDTINAVLVYVEGSYGVGHAATPATPILVQLISISTSGVVTVIAQKSDPTAHPGYDVVHPISLNTAPLPYLVLNDPLYVRVVAETDANSVNDTTAVRGIEGVLTARGFRAQNEVL